MVYSLEMITWQAHKGVVEDYRRQLYEDNRSQLYEYYRSNQL
jgi:hypothetical protein